MRVPRAAAILLAVLCAGRSAAEPFRFVQISDTHQGRAIHQWRYRQAIAQINDLPFDVDVVVHTGDIVSAGFKSHEVAGAASNLFAQIRWPRISCPGNHDLRFDRASDAWTNRYYRAAAVYQTFFGPLAQAHETTNALYLALDTEEIRQPGAFATFWGRQASYRVYSYEDGCLSYQDAYIADPPEGAHITHDGFIVEPPAEEAPAPVADPPAAEAAGAVDPSGAEAAGHRTAAP